MEKRILKFIKKIRRRLNGSYSVHTYWTPKYCILSIINNSNKNIESQATIREDNFYSWNKNTSCFLSDEIQLYFKNIIELEENEI